MSVSKLMAFWTLIGLTCFLFHGLFQSVRHLIIGNDNFWTSRWFLLSAWATVIAIFIDAAYLRSLFVSGVGEED